MSLLLLQAATSCGLKTLWQWQTSRLRTSEFLEKASFHKARDMLVVFVAFVLSRNGTGLWLGATESSPRISLKNERAKGRSNEWHESKQASVFWHKQPYSNLATLIEHRKRPLKGALATAFLKGSIKGWEFYFTSAFMQSQNTHTSHQLQWGATRFCFQSYGCKKAIFLT